MIVRAQIEERLALLRKEQEQIQERLVQLQANLNAYAGAIEDCQFWLAALEKEEQAEEVK